MLSYKKFKDKKRCNPLIGEVTHIAIEPGEMEGRRGRSGESGGGGRVMDSPARVNEFGHYSFLPFLRSVRKSKPFFCDVLFSPLPACRNVLRPGSVLWTERNNYKVKMELAVCNSTRL